MTKRPSTRQRLVKIPHYPFLYRHKISGAYYGINKLRGKRKEHSSTWRNGLDIRVSQVMPSMLDEWMAQHERDLKNSSFNRYPAGPDPAAVHRLMIVFA